VTTYGNFLEIADTLVTRGRAAIGEIEGRVRNLPRELTLAEQVSGGLVLKMLASFEALVEDVRDGRGEAMHHPPQDVVRGIHLSLRSCGEQRTGGHRPGICVRPAHQARERSPTPRPRARERRDRQAERVAASSPNPK
jgi:hypothetical protein